MKLSGTVALAVAQLAVGQELMRFQCSQLSIDRIDPLVNPGQAPSPHMHQIVGGNSFNISMDPDNHDLPSKSTCTSCIFSEDFSNYWTANMWFQARNGSFKRVPQRNNLGTTANGGITVYYIRGYQQSAKPSTFKPGFRMLVGDPMNTDPRKVSRGVCFRMEQNANQSPFGGAPCTGGDTPGFPNTPVWGFRITVTFPTCWDGKTLNPPDHKSHMAYPQTGTFESGGACPASHPVKVPQLMYEVIYDTSEFKSKDLWPAADDPQGRKQPFVWSHGDGIGAGNHGDYVFGWKGDALQRAMDGHCANAGPCKNMKTQSAAEAMKCTKEQFVKEPINDWYKQLPGSPKVVYR